MEKLSFLKYLKVKEKKFLKQIELLEQTGGVSLDLKDIQAELLSIKIKLDVLNKAKQTKLLNPYNELKPLIDSINLKIADIDNQIKTLNTTDEIEKNRLINEIKDINIELSSIDAAASNYTNVQVNSKIEFLKEKVNPQLVNDLFNKYINDTKGLVNELIQIGGVNGTLINNNEIGEKIIQINKKISEYKSAIIEIDTKMKPINSHITEMESLYKDIKIDPFLPKEIDSKLTEKIRINKIDENTKFSYFDVDESKYSPQNLVDPKTVLDKKHKFQQKYFIEQSQIPLPDTEPHLNDSIFQLYKNWKDKLTKKKEDNENLLDYIEMKEYLEFLKTKFNNFKQVNNITQLINITDNQKSEITNLLNNLVKIEPTINTYIYNCTKENKECIIENLDNIKENNLKVNKIVNLISEKLNENIKHFNNLPNKDENYRASKIRPIREFLEKINNNPNNIQQVGGQNGEMGDFITSVGEFENEIRTMVQKRNEIIMKIKHYNVRYTQFISFQKYIVNYISLTIAQGSYDYYQYLSKGTISFYDSLLEKIEKIIDKFESQKDFNDPILQEEENRVLYSRHYFIIKMLANFFNKLYKYWDQQYQKNKTTWGIDKRINVEDVNKNKKYLFLFNIFFKFLDAYHMNMPSVANYLRINDVQGAPGNEVYRKNIKDKHLLDAGVINDKCTNLNNDPSKTSKVNAVQHINFEEVFDPENFKENANLSLYMGLSNTLADRKSIMLLTYGYSGVGKTFTLFGRAKAGEKPHPGLLQTTLKNITDYVKIEMKAFELYGLGVPYKFYWQKNPKDFDHRIYLYKNINGTNAGEPIEYNADNFDAVLNSDQSYREITSDQIDRFSGITDGIDKHREKVGRIRPTINNPESSRSIMIYDFKITFKDKSCKFVIMDLPGKENLFQTYCKETGQKDNYKPVDKYTKNNGKTYNSELIKSMMYINPLWMSTIPEIAEHFDNADNTKKWDPEILPTFPDVNFRGNFKLSKPEEVRAINSGAYSNKRDYTSYFNILKNNAAHKQTQDFRKDKQFEKFNGLSTEDKLKLSLHGVCDRAFNNILDYIQDENGKSRLFDLAEKINQMLPEGDLQKKKFGYAGLEGIYINENILGLLEVLGEKIQQQRRAVQIKNVVCPQKEIFKKLYSSRQTKTPISYNLLRKTGQVDQNGAFIKDATIFAEDNEFYSQILFMNHFLSPTGNSSFYKPSSSNKLLTGMVDGFKQDYQFSNVTKGIVNNIEDPNKNWVNNYDYNSIFNIKNPPIKSILKNYLKDDSFSNFYLFFVVSNNFKKGTTIDTCDKQLQLLYDTRVFMDIIANEKAEGIQCSI
jgi:hypothetical protein